MLKNMIFPAFAFCVAGCTIYFFRNSDFYLMLVNAGIAILGFLLYLLRVSFYKFLLFTWIILQAVIIELEAPLSFPVEDLGLESVQLSQFDFSQALLLSHEKAQMTINGTMISFNLLTPVYLIVFISLLLVKAPEGEILKQPKMIEYGGDTFELKLFRLNQIMEQIAPQKVQVLRKVDFGDSNNWLLVRLTKPAKFKNGRVIYSALIKGKDDPVLKKNLKGQLAHFRIIPDRKLLKNGQLSLKKTRFVDWVFVQ